MDFEKANNIILIFFVYERIMKLPKDGFQFHIQRAKWSILDNSIVEQLPKVVINDVPVIHFVVSFFDNVLLESLFY